MGVSETTVEQDRSYEPIETMREHGLLWLINRVVFHPRGLALAFNLDDDGQVTGWKILGDGTEVWTFTSDADDAEFAKVQAFLATVTTRSFTPRLEALLRAEGFTSYEHPEHGTLWGHPELGQGRHFIDAVTWQLGRDQAQAKRSMVEGEA